MQTVWLVWEYSRVTDDRLLEGVYDTRESAMNAAKHISGEYLGDFEEWFIESYPPKYVAN